MEANVYATVFEFLMLILFGVSWPFNIAKSLKARTARGKSLLFEVCIALGYICGIAGKVLGGNITYIIAVYGLNLAMVTIDLILTLRNMAFDHVADRKAAKAEKAREQEKEKEQEKQAEEKADPPAVTGEERTTEEVVR